MKNKTKLVDKKVQGLEQPVNSHNSRTLYNILKKKCFVPQKVVQNLFCRTAEQISEVGKIY